MSAPLVRFGRRARSRDIEAAEHKVKLRFSVGDNAALFRFYGELNDFLAPERRGHMILYRFDVSGSIKDAVESLGVPHAEIGLMVVNHDPVEFGYQIQRGDYVSVYPEFRSIDISSLPVLRPAFSRPPRFVLDVHLGRLAGYLRLLGFDTLYRNHFSDPDLARTASAELRILLTRDRDLLKRNEVVHGYWVRRIEPREQLLEVVRRFELSPEVDLFTRCLICNTRLKKVDREAVASRVPERTAMHFQDFHTCPQCDRVYWRGSHYRRMLHLVGRILRDARAGD